METTARLKRLHGKTWRQHYVPQSPPRTPLGAIWRCMIENLDLWPPTAGLSNRKMVVWEDVLQPRWIEDASNFSIFLNRYPPARQLDGTFEAARDYCVIKATRIRRQNLLKLSGYSGYVAALLHTPELLCPPRHWPPALDMVWQSDCPTTQRPTPRDVANLFLTANALAPLPNHDTSILATAEPLAVLTLILLGVTPEQLELAHENVPSGRYGGGRTTQHFIGLAQQGLRAALGSPAFYIWASGHDFHTSPVVDSTTATLINAGVRVQWDTPGLRTAVYYEAKAAVDEYRVIPRNPSDPQPWADSTWASVPAMLQDPASHILKAFSLGKKFSTSGTWRIDIDARPADPRTTPATITKIPGKQKTLPYRLARATTMTEVYRALRLKEPKAPKAPKGR